MINLQPGIPQKEPQHFETLLFIVSQFWKIGIFGHALLNCKDLPGLDISASAPKDSINIQSKRYN